MQPPAERAEASKHNLLGRLTRHDDEAGRLEVGAYDFKGNELDKTRRVISDAALAAGWKPDWDAPGADDALYRRAYRTTTRYDALNREIEVILPADAVGHSGEARAALRPVRRPPVRRTRPSAVRALLAHNARGQRILAAYGSGVLTRHAYDPNTFRLVRLRSEASNSTSKDTWTGHGAPLQDLTYAYDLVGNVVTVEEQTPGCGVAGTADGPNRLTRRFTYDALYRLTEATGRACRDIPQPRPFSDDRRCGSYPAPYSAGAPTPNQANAPNVTMPYTETFQYDPAGNLLRLRNVVPAGSWSPRRSWNRWFGMGGGSRNSGARQHTTISPASAGPEDDPPPSR